MNEQAVIFDYVDDYCYECEVMCKQTDPLHKEHNTMAKSLKSPDKEEGSSHDKL